MQCKAMPTSEVIGYLCLLLYIIIWLPAVHNWWMRWHIFIMIWKLFRVYKQSQGVQSSAAVQSWLWPQHFPANLEVQYLWCPQHKQHWGWLLLSPLTTICTLPILNYHSFSSSLSTTILSLGHAIFMMVHVIYPLP